MELATIANICQIIGTIWAIGFGGKALFDVIKLKKTPSSGTFTNILLALILVTMISFVLHPPTVPLKADATHQPQSQRQGTGTISNPTQISSPIPAPTVTPLVSRKNLVIPCVDCTQLTNGTNAIIEVLLESIVVNMAQENTTLKFSITNDSGKICRSVVFFPPIEIEDQAGNKAQATGTANDSWSMTTSQQIKFDAVYNSLVLQSGTTYTLRIEMQAYCGDAALAEVHDYQTVTFQI